MITTDSDGYLMNSYPDRNPFETWDLFKAWKNLKDAKKIGNDTRFGNLETKDNDLDLKDVQSLE